MTRRVLAPAFALLFSFTVCSSVLAQATPAAPAQAAPAARAKWVAPIKGEATIEVIRGNPRRVGDDIVSPLKIKNTSKAPIALLGINEYWYDKNNKMISGSGTQKIKKLIGPGEVIDVTSSSPWKPDLYTNQFQFDHANGKISAKPVKKFTEQ